MAKVAVLGCGTVGSGVVKLLLKNRDLIKQRLGEEIEVKWVLEQQPEKVLALGLDRSILAENFEQIAKDEEVKVIVELIGGIEPAKSFILQAMREGKSVVTANKDLIAEYGQEIFELVQMTSCDFMFEASVGGGIPIVFPLKQSLAGNRIKEVIGIVNGTTNYILTKMSEENRDFAEVLKEAQQLGYAEADPSADVDGYDAARKIAILASIAFNSRITFKDVYVEGIRKISPLDIKYGRELGYTVKLLAVAKEEEEGRVQVRVHPAFIPAAHPLAAVNGVYNAVFVRGDAVGDLMFYGRGAGQLPTASAVVGDLMEVVRNIRRRDTGRISCTCYESKSVVPISELKAEYYIRMSVVDRPGVLAGIAGVFGNQNVSLATVLQKTSGEEVAQLVLVTHRVEEANLRDALLILEGMSIVKSIDNVIRLEGTTAI